MDEKMILQRFEIFGSVKFVNPSGVSQMLS